MLTALWVGGAVVDHENYIRSAIVWCSVVVRCLGAPHVWARGIMQLTRGGTATCTSICIQALCTCKGISYPAQHSTLPLWISLQLCSSLRLLFSGVGHQADRFCAAKVLYLARCLGSRKYTKGLMRGSIHQADLTQHGRACIAHAAARLPRLGANSYRSNPGPDGTAYNAPVRVIWRLRRVPHRQ